MYFSEVDSDETSPVSLGTHAHIVNIMGCMVVCVCVCACMHGCVCVCVCVYEAW